MSIGNDIVAIKSSDPERVKLYSFYSKILSEEEQTLYKTYKASMPFEIYIWLLWSIKESVYKRFKRSDADLIFAPVRINVAHLVFPVTDFDEENSIIEHMGFDETVCYRSEISYQGASCYSRSIITDDYIYTVVSIHQSFENIYWGIKQIDDPHYQRQSEQVRSFVSGRLSTLFPNQSLQIGKSESGYPFLSQNGKELAIPLSFSHHGHFVAYAFCLTDNQLPFSV